MEIHLTSNALRFLIIVILVATILFAISTVVSHSVEIGSAEVCSKTIGELWKSAKASAPDEAAFEIQKDKLIKVWKLCLDSNFKAAEELANEVESAILNAG